MGPTFPGALRGPCVSLPPHAPRAICSRGALFCCWGFGTGPTWAVAAEALRRVGTREGLDGERGCRTKRAVRRVVATRFVSCGKKLPQFIFVRYFAAVIPVNRRVAISDMGIYQLKRDVESERARLTGMKIPHEIVLRQFIAAGN